MTDLAVRCTTLSDTDAVPHSWREAAEGTGITDAHDGPTRLIARDPEALLPRGAGRPDRRQGIAAALTDAAERRFLARDGRRVDA
ncbi:hypothetical protein ACWD04_28355 [Streptomyces sp. NPDC002911]